MPPELLPIIIQWGPVALILFGILYRADQACQKILNDLFPVIIQHFARLDEGFETMKKAVDNQTEQTKVMAQLASRIEEMGIGISEDHAAIADDAKNAHHHARRAADAAEEILLRIPHRLVDKEGA